MGYIKEEWFHIKGTPKENETERCTKNYVHAALGYDKGCGYYWIISRAGRFTVHDEVYGDHVLCSFTLGDKSPSLYEIVVPCKRAGKAREREGVQFFDNSVIFAIKNLGYDIEI